ncbi:MAG TPA: DUF4082 domain-containing protein, partial [Pseudolabrys sp.]|nr:DUF4082 domain-containing protein [Pseudolabrys sp.]
TATGTNLASATFSNTAASGWQTVNLTTPVTIAANTTYVASYHTTGAYVATTNFFTADANDSSRQWLGGVKRSQERGGCRPSWPAPCAT